jgi:hypothetical protein
MYKDIPQIGIIIMDQTLAAWREWRGAEGAADSEEGGTC